MQHVAPPVVQPAQIAHVSHAVQQVRILDTAHAVGGEAAIARAERRDGSRRQTRQTKPIAAIQRKLGNPLPVDHASGGAGLAIDQRRCRVDFDSLESLPYFKLKIQAQPVLNLQRDRGAHGFLEARRLDSDLVTSRTQQRRRVETLFVCRALHSDVRFDVADGDTGARDPATGSIGHGSIDTGKIELREHNTGSESKYPKCFHSE